MIACPVTGLGCILEVVIPADDYRNTLPTTCRLPYDDDLPAEAAGVRQLAWLRLCPWPTWRPAGSCSSARTSFMSIIQNPT
jgi:hypothetical protein